jgi:hypothetical protein
VPEFSRSFEGAV